MINVGVVGLGMMGLTHIDVYSRRPDVRLLAISDKMPDRLEGRVRATGNVEGQARGTVDYASVRKYAEAMDLIRDPDIHVVDICLPTPLHAEYAIAALEAGKHTLIEKPVARTLADARRIADAAAAASRRGVRCMVAMCMRFWPGWTFLKQAVDDGRFGKVLCAHFRRVASHPGGPFYSDGAACGGALLDLHIHDTDFVQHCFGSPAEVHSVGYSRITSEIDHVITRYRYDNGPLVLAEGGWAMAAGFPFTMQYTVNFERATAVYDLGANPPAVVYADGAPQPVALESGTGYDGEINYFLDCIAAQRDPQKVTMADAVNCIRILEAERHSVIMDRPVTLQ